MPDKSSITRTVGLLLGLVWLISNVLFAVRADKDTMQVVYLMAVICISGLVSAICLIFASYARRRPTKEEKNAG